MKRSLSAAIFLFAFLVSFQSAFTQVVISDNPAATGDPAAMLDIQSTEGGLLIPRMAQAQRDAIASPPTSLVIYQIDNTPGLYYNTGTPASPNWQKITDANFIGGYWTQNGTDLYYTTGNVGVGNSAPSANLDITGSIWASDSLYITGRPGKIFLNGETLYEAGIRFAYNGNSVFRLHNRIGNGYLGDPYLMLDSDVDTTLWGVTSYGKIWQRYIGGGNAYNMYSSAPSPALYINNNNNTVNARAINAVLSNTSVPAAVTIGGWGYGQATGLYGQNYGTGTYAHIGSQYHGVSGYYSTGDNHGTLGSERSGVYGENVIGYWGAIGIDDPSTPNDEYGVYGDDGVEPEPNYGGLGTSNHGAYGKHTNQHWGSLGSSSSGAYGEHADGHIGRLGYTDAGARGELAATNSDGDFGVKGYGVNSAEDDGSGFDYDETRGGVFGINTGAAQYTFGVAGYTPTGTSEDHRGGVIGADAAANTWGALGYLRSSGPTWCAGYFSSAPVTGSGNGNKNTSMPISSMAISAYGDLFGAQINGGIYGLYAEGNNYSIFARGDMYRTGADVHLQEDDSGQNNIMYTLVSPEMTIQTYGLGQLQAGKASIAFDDAFSRVVSDAEPIIVAITPIGDSEGVHLEQVDARGFVVVENRSGKSGVQFSWIAIGKRKGYENVSLPADVTAADYTLKIEQGLSNDGNPDESAGEGLYYQNGELHVGPVPSQGVGTEVNVIDRASPEVKMNRVILPEDAKAALPEIKEASEDRKSTDKIN